MTISLQINADVRGQRQVDRLNTSLGRTGTVADATSRAIRTLGTVLAGVSFALVAREITRSADAMRSLNAQLQATGSSASVAANQIGLVAQIAQDTGSAFDATADVFARLQRSTRELGASTNQVATATTAIQQSFALAGSSASEAASASLQLGQALSSGTLQGDELRSILENNAVLAGLIAEEFMVSVGALRDLGAEGALTSDRVFGAILDGSREINDQFAGFGNLYSQSANRIRNASVLILGELGGIFDEITGINSSITDFTNDITFAFRSGDLQRVILSFIRDTVRAFTTVQRAIRDAFDFTGINLSDRLSAVFAGITLTAGSIAVLSALGTAAATAIRAALFVGLAPLNLSRFLIARLVLGTNAASAGTLISPLATTRFAAVGARIGGLIGTGIGGATGIILGSMFADAIGLDEGSFASLGIQVAAAIGVGALTGRAATALSNSVGLALTRLGNSYRLNTVTRTRLGRIGGLASTAIAGGLIFESLFPSNEDGEASGASDYGKRIGTFIAAAAAIEVGLLIGPRLLAALVANPIALATLVVGVGILDIVFNESRIISSIGETIAEVVANAVTSIDNAVNDAVDILFTGPDPEDSFSPTIENLRERFNENISGEDGSNINTSAGIINDLTETGINLFDSGELARGLIAFNEQIQNLNNIQVDQELEAAIAALTAARERAEAVIRGRQGSSQAIPERQTGGPVFGPGTGTSDSILARLSNGEFVINAEATSRYRPLLEEINSGSLPAFAPGGIVGNTIEPPVGGTSANPTQLIMTEDQALLESNIRNREIQEAVGQDIRDTIDQARLDSDTALIDNQTLLLNLTNTEIARLNNVISGFLENDEQARREQEGGDQGNAFTDLFNFDFMAIGMMAQQQLSSSLSEAFRSGDFSDVVGNVLDTFTGSIVDSFASNVSAGLFDIIGMIDFSQIIRLITGFFGFNTGGIVPTTSSSIPGVDSVPTLLTPGETVIPVGGSASAETSNSNVIVNLEVVGDVSASTRREITMMLPQIINATQATLSERRVLNNA